MKIETSSWIKLREMALFLIVGVLNTAVDFLVLNLLILFTHHDHGWWLLPFDAISFLAAVINSYVLNKHITFRHSSGSGDSWRFLRFVAVNAVGLVVNSVTVWALAPVLQVILSPLAAVNLSKVLATVISLFWNYFAIKHWIFRREKPLMKGEDEDSLVPMHVIMESETKSAV